ncbi:iron-containing alcohol dehydrogenase, partial [Klebsiella pneumoniae]
LPHVVALNAPNAPQVASRLAAALNESAATPPPVKAETDVPGAAAVQALNQLYDDVGAPRALQTVGFTENNIDEAVRRAMEVAPNSNPTPAGESDLRYMLCAALK